MPMANTFYSESVYSLSVCHEIWIMDSVCYIVICARCGNGLTGSGKICVISFGFQLLMVMHDWPIKIGSDHLLRHNLIFTGFGYYSILKFILIMKMLSYGTQQNSGPTVPQSIKNPVKKSSLRDFWIPHSLRPQTLASGASPSFLMSFYIWCTIFSFYISTCCREIRSSVFYHKMRITTCNWCHTFQIRDVCNDDNVYEKVRTVKLLLLQKFNFSLFYVPIAWNKLALSNFLMVLTLIIDHNDSFI